MYPYRIRITDPALIDIFKKVSNHRYSKVDSYTAKRIGHRIPRTIKRDGVIIHNGTFAVYNPELRIDVEPAYGKRKGYDFIFKRIF